jgi:hypothetical protein
MFASEDWRASKDRAPAASLNKRDHYSRKTLALQQQMRWQDMSQDHSVRNRNHHVELNRRRLYRSMAAIDSIRGTYHAYRAFRALFLGRRSGSLLSRGLGSALSSLSSLSSHIFCASPEENDRQSDRRDLLSIMRRQNPRISLCSGQQSSPRSRSATRVFRRSTQGVREDFESVHHSKLVDIARCHGIIG